MNAKPAVGTTDLSGPGGYSALAASIRWPKPDASTPQAVAATAASSSADAQAQAPKAHVTPDLTAVPGDPTATIRRAESAEASALAARPVDMNHIVYNARVAALAASIELAASRVRATLHDANADELDVRNGNAAYSSSKLSQTLFGPVKDVNQIDFTA